MVLGKSERSRMVGHARQPKRLWMIDQVTEHAAAARQRADRLVGLGVDAGREELRQRVAPVVEHAQRDVAGAGQLARDVHKLLQQRVEFEVGHQAAADLDQAAQARLVEFFEVVDP